MVLPPSTICKPGGEGGMFLPILSNETEDAWPFWLRAFLYLVAMLYSFMGVGFISDMFMEAIESITSTQKEVMVEDKTTKKQVRTKVRVWNETVANLTLMALGSSAPEIMLNVVEVAGRGYFAGNLGPSTIVGSAAFNFLIIIAVCIVAVPAGEERRIRSFATFVITTIWSAFAYLWMYLTISVISPDVIEVWEAVLTFAFLPILVYMGYHADIGTFGMNDAVYERRPTRSGDQVAFGVETAAEWELALMEQMRDVRAREDARGAMTDEQVARIAAEELGLTQRRSIARYRLEVNRKHPVRHRMKKVVAHTMHFLFPVVSFDQKDKAGRTARGSFSRDKQGAAVPREGETEEEFKARRREAKALKHAIREVQREMFLEAQGVGFYNQRHNPQPTFFQRLRESLPGGKKAARKRELRWHARELVLLARQRQQERDDLARHAFLGPDQGGARSEDPSHAAGGGRPASEGHNPPVTLELDPMGGESAEEAGPPISLWALWQDQIVDALTPDVDDEEEDEDSELEVVAAEPGDPEIALVYEVDAAGKSALRRSSGSLGSMVFPTDQVPAADAPGAEASEDEAKPSAYDWTMHLIALPFKLLYAITVPPPAWRGGLPAFFVALAHIALLTALVADEAGILGCVLGIPDPVTAITLVALGTSLPDTFASMIAAKSEPTADASITNVTGSNSVNVFLGLGLPWLFASIYWKYAPQDGAPAAEWRATYPDVAARLAGQPHYVVLGGDLGFSVAIFCVMCAVGSALILYRRFVLGAELGGPVVAKYVSSAILMTLWASYIVLVVLKFTGGI